MEKHWIETFKLWAETDEYHGKVKEAQKIIKKALTRYNNPYLSYSGGKDSLVMTHLILQEDPDIPVWHWDYGDALMPREIEKEVIDNAYKIGVKNLIIRKRRGRDARTNHGSGYKQFFGVLNHLKKENNWDLGFIGVRREESKKRERNYKSHFIENNCYPLLNLSWIDIWAYIVSNNLNYPSTYDKYSKVYGWDKSRFVTFFDGEFDFLGSSNVDGVLMPEFRNL